MIKNKCLETIKEYKLLNPGETVLVAVSGGVDSIALLYLMDHYREKFGCTLHIAHLNHMIRKKDADLDVRFVQGLARDLKVPITVESIDVQALAKERKIGIEAAARQVRYSFFEKVAEKIGADKIAVGHTADDNVETFLMRLVRGAGLKGLCGIPPKRGKIIRPLIKIWRKEIEIYVGALKLVPRRDYTNYESKYMRNRVRMKLIPQLKLYNLNIKEIVLQTILLLTEDSEYLEAKAEEALERISETGGENEIRVKIDKLRDLEDPIQGHLLRQAIEKVKGNITDLTYTHVCDILDKLEASEKWEIHLPGGIYAVGNRGELLICREKPGVAARKIFSYSLSVPGEIKIEEIGKKLRAEFSDERDNEEDPNVAFVDYSALGKKLTVRNKEEGDRLQPLGMKGNKKLQDLFVDAKIPAEARDSIPVVESGGKIVWVGGLRLDDRAKVSNATKKIVKLELL
jgi:tRNA(Ile)-lysidine synthase